MFAYLRGVITVIKAPMVVVDVHGIGFLAQVPEPFLSKVRVGQEVMMPVYTVWREDSVDLYGFADEEQKSLFLQLISVNGVGPKLALSILSTLRIEDFTRAVMDNDYKKIATTPGVGKKLAQRIILEIKSRLGEDTELAKLISPSESTSSETDEAYQALISMGCTPAEARSAVNFARQQLGVNSPIEEVIRYALQSLHVRKTG